MSTSLTLGSFTPSVLLRVARDTGALAERRARGDRDAGAVVAGPVPRAARRQPRRGADQPGQRTRLPLQPDATRSGGSPTPGSCPPWTAGSASGCTPRPGSRRGPARRARSASTCRTPASRSRCTRWPSRSAWVGTTTRWSPSAPPRSGCRRCCAASATRRCSTPATSCTPRRPAAARCHGGRRLRAVPRHRARGGRRGPAGADAGGWPPRCAPDRGRASSPAGSTTTTAAGRRRARAAGAAGRALPRPAARTRTRGSCRTARSTRPRSGRSSACAGATCPRPTAGPTCSPRRWRRGPACWSRLMAAPMPPTTEPGRSSLRLLQLTSFVSTLDRFAMPPMLLAISRDLVRPAAVGGHRGRRLLHRVRALQPVWGIVSDRLGRVRTLRVTLLLAGGRDRACRPRAATSPGSVVARGIAGGLFGAAMPDLPDLPRRHGARPAPAAGGDPADGRRRARHGAGLGRRRRAGPAAHLAGGVRDHRRLRRWCWPCCCAGCPSRAAGRGSPARPARAGRRARRSRCSCCCCAFAEGVVLLGTLTLLPPAVEPPAPATAVAGAVTGVYGARSWRSRRWSGGCPGAGTRARLIGSAAPRRSPVPDRGAVPAGRRWPPSRRVLLGLAWAAMHSSLQTWATEVLPDARAAVVSLFAGSLFVGSALARRGGRPGRRRPVRRALRARARRSPYRSRCGRRRPGPMAPRRTRSPTAYRFRTAN